MKLINNTNYNRLFSFLIGISLCLLVFSQEKKGSQLTAFPNTNEALTSKDQLGKFNYTVPPLSRSLFEEDPQRKIKMKDFTSAVKYSMYSMSRGEAEQMFNFADKDHDNLLDQNEWDAFTTLFILPFEACDKNGDYILDKAEFKACWDADPRARVVEFKKNIGESKYDLIIDTVTTKGKGRINFSDYLFIRKSLFAWKECHSSSKVISISAFKCALRIAVPVKHHLKIDLERIYKTGLKMTNDPSIVDLDYISYLRVVYFTYVFSIFGLPHDSPWLEKNQFIKAVREDRYPAKFEENEVEYLYSLITTDPFQKQPIMNFESFCFFFNLHRLFNKYSLDKPLQLNETELIKLLDDPLNPTGITLSVDASRTNFTESQYLEVSTVLHRLRLNERDFYYSFKQDENANSANTKPQVNGFYDKTPNATNRHFFFTSMCGIDKRYWTKEIFFRTFQWANLFTELASDKRWLVSASTFIEKLPTLYESINPPISQMNRNNYILYKSIPKEIYIDILTFLTLENNLFKFNLHKMNSNELINETLLKIILKDSGMENMPDTVIDLAKKGFDSLRRRMYLPSEVVKYIIIVHAAAGENVRNKEYLKIFNLKINNDPMRKYPNFPKRFLSSPLV